MKRFVAFILALSMVFALCACGSGNKISKELEHNKYKSSWQALGNSYTVIYHFGENGAAEKDWTCVYSNGNVQNTMYYGYYTVKGDKIIVYCKEASEEKFSEFEFAYKQDGNGTITLFDNLDRPYKQQ